MRKLILLFVYIIIVYLNSGEILKFNATSWTVRETRGNGQEILWVDIYNGYAKVVTIPFKNIKFIEEK